MCLMLRQIQIRIFPGLEKIVEFFLEFVCNYWLITGNWQRIPSTDRQYIKNYAMLIFSIQPTELYNSNAHVSTKVIINLDITPSPYKTYLLISYVLVIEVVRKQSQLGGFFQTDEALQRAFCNRLPTLFRIPLSLYSLSS